jgi:hypothetical protein
MNKTLHLRKPKFHFDVGGNPSHVTFDDGKDQRRNFPWMHYVEARWEYAEPDLVKIEIGDCLVLVRGHNLAPLFQAVEDHALIRVRAQPELEHDPDREIDSFATGIAFMKAPGAAGPKGPRQSEFDLLG